MSQNKQGIYTDDPRYPVHLRDKDLETLHIALEYYLDNTNAGNDTWNIAELLNKTLPTKVSF